MFSILFSIVLLVWIITLSRRVDALEKNNKHVEPHINQKASPQLNPVMSTGVMSAVQPQPSQTQMDTSQKPPVMPNNEDSEFVWAKWLARAGVLAILAGMAFFLKLAIDYGWIGVMGRVAIGILVGLIGIGIGQYLRPKYKGYSNLLIGGGLSVLYITIFFMHFSYHLIASGTALVLMVGVTALSVVMSVVDKAQGLARMGIVGGFLAPLLISASHVNMFQLFTYALVLDLGVLAVSYWQKWYRLNFIAFIGTFILYVIGLAESFVEGARTEVLLYTTVFFLVFLIVSVAHHIFRKEKSNKFDAIFIALNAIWYGVAVYALVEPVAKDFLGFYMLGIALVYALIALLSFMRDRSDRLLNHLLTGLCVAFLTVAVPLQFSGAWITSMWFIEAIILFAVDYSLRGKNLLSLGSVVYILGVFRYFTLDSFERYWARSEYTVTILNQRFAMLLFIIASGVVLGVLARKISAVLVPSLDNGINDQDIKAIKKLGALFFIASHCLAIYLVTSETIRHYDRAENKVWEKLERDIDERQAYLGDTVQLYKDPVYQQLQVEQYKDLSSVRNRQSVAVSIVWALYSSALLAFGFFRKTKGFRIAGLIGIFITLFKVFIDIWNLGGIYRVVGSIAVGVLALLGSFLYAKYKHRIKDVVIGGTTALAIALGLFGSVVPQEASALSLPAGVSSWHHTLEFMAPMTPASSGEASNTYTTSQAVKIDIPIEVLPYTTLNDIRVLQKTNDNNEYSQLVPHIEMGNVQAGQDRVISPGILSPSVRGGQAFAILDLGTPGLVHDNIDLGISGSESFARKVSLYSSDTLLPLDSSAWKLVTNSGYVYSYKDTNANLTARDTSFSYPKNNGRYLKVIVAEDQSFKSGRISIVGAQVRTLPSTYSNHEQKIITLHPQNISVIEDATQGSSEIVLDIGKAGIFSHELNLAVNDDQEFIRNVVVQYMDSDTGEIDGGAWKHIADATISNIKDGNFSHKNLRITYPEIRSRFIRVIVFNKDNQPINFSKSTDSYDIKSKVRSIMFDIKPGTKIADYALFFGNKNVQAPQYDLAQIKSYETGTPIMASVGPIQMNKSYIPPVSPQKPWSQRNRVILNTALVLMVIVIGGFVFMYVKKAKNSAHSDII